MRRETSAGVVVYRWDSRLHKPVFLLLQYLSGHWDFAKGKIEAGETKQQTALRELMEETGLVAELEESFEEALSYFFRSKGELVHKDVIFFVGHAMPGDVILSREHIGYQWLPFEEAVEQLTFENARQVIQVAFRHIMKRHKQQSTKA